MQMPKIKGWKTLTGAAGMVVCTVIVQYFGGDSEAIGQTSNQWLELIEAARVAFGGLAVVGVGHKIDKVNP